jgi:hypothetical protein
MKATARGMAALLLVTAAAASTDNPRQLQDEMVKVENEFFALYNQLNTDHQFDMVCRNERQTGSRFDARVCQPRYLLTAKENAASERVHSAIAAGESSAPANSRGPDVGAAVAGGTATAHVSKDEAFRQNLLDVLQKSPELQGLGKKRDELQTRYEAATKGTGGR